MKKIPYIIIIILIILNGFLSYTLKTKSSSYNRAMATLNSEVEKNKTELATFKQNFDWEKTNDHLKMDANLALIDITGKTVLAKEILKTNSLVLRYSELNCHECIDAAIKSLIDNKSNIKKDVVLIASYQTQRDLYVYYKEFQKQGLTNIKMFLLPERGLAIPIDQLSVPYFFCVDSNLIMNNFFIPQKENAKLANIYLNYTAKNFLN